MSKQLWILAAVLGFVLTFHINEARAAEGDDDDDEAEEAEEYSLRPRNLASSDFVRFRASQSVAKGGWSYSQSSSSRFSLGAYLIEDISLARGSTSSRATAPVDGASVADSDSGASSSSVALPVLTLRGGYQLSDNVSLIALGSLDFNDGPAPLDPAAGIGLQLPIGKDVLSVSFLTVSAPLSQASQDSGKVTTVTGSWGPIYQNKNFFVGGNVAVGASFYRNDVGSQSSTPSGAGFRASPGPTMPATSSTKKKLPTNTKTQLASGEDTESVDFSGRELIRAGGEAFVGLAFAKQVTGNVALGATAIGREDSSDTQWITEATIARLTFASGNFRGSGAFTLVSGPGLAAPQVPTQPGVGLRIQYVFGSQATLGVNSTENVPVRP